MRGSGPDVGDNRLIEETVAPQNPVSGCTKLTAGCDRRYCDTELIAKRIRGTQPHASEHGFDLPLGPDRLPHPLSGNWRWMIFINSMSDLLHTGVPRPCIDRTFATK